MTKQETDNYIKIGLTLLAVVAVFYLFSKLEKGAAGLLESLGLKDTEDEKKTQAELDKAAGGESKPQPPSAEWTPKDFNYLQPDTSLANLDKWIERQRANKKPVRAAKFLPGYWKKAAQNIYNSVGVIYDDPEKGLAEIKQLRTKAGLCYLQRDFKALTGKDLFTWLNTKYDTDRQKEVLNQIYKYCEGLPVGVINTTTNQITI